MPGTPPLARGRGVLIVFLLTKNGNTPACAGKGVRTAVRYKACREHPRLRGEGVFF